MGRMRILGLALLAVFALGAISAAGASATEPGWYECAKNKEAGTLEKGCLPFAGGKAGYEVKPGLGKGKGFKLKGGEAVLHVKTYLGDNTVICAASKGTGLYEAPNRVKDVVISYSKCVALTTKTCASAGAKKGEIKTQPLSGELGYVESSPVNVGLKLENEATPGPTGLVEEFECVNLEVKAHGEMIGELKGNTNAFSKESELVYVSSERIGEHEFEGHKFSPSVNIIGFEDEMEEIEKEEKAPQVQRAVICGEYIKNILKQECTPEANTGLSSTFKSKGEAIEVKA